jgi:hypothetical protein
MCAKYSTSAGVSLVIINKDYINYIDCSGLGNFKQKYIKNFTVLIELRPFVGKLSKISTARNWFARSYIS